MEESVPPCGDSLNLKTAQALEITMPPSLLLLADEGIR